MHSKPQTAQGVAFDVIIFEDYVVKIPKDSKSKEIMPMMADIQCQLSEKIEAVLPAWVMYGVLVMPKAPGERFTGIKERRQHIKNLVNNAVGEIKKHGYTLTDTGRKNVYYDETTDKVYLIDFHLVKKDVT